MLKQVQHDILLYFHTFSRGLTQKPDNTEKLNFLKPIQEDAHLKNLRKIKKLGIDKFLEESRKW